MTRPSRQFIYKVFYFVLLLIALAVIVLSIIISQLELDDYRQELEQTLSKVLDQPVSIGSGSLTYQRGIALGLYDLRIGPPEAPLIVVPRLAATLQIKPLLDGKFVFDRVLVDSPKLQIWLPVAKHPGQGNTHELLNKLGIGILTIENAELHIYQRSAKETRLLLHLENLFLALTGWEEGKSGRLTINGQYIQAQQPADFTIELSLPTSTDPRHWRSENFHCQLSVQNFSTALLPKTTDGEVPKSVDFLVSLDGTPAAGAILQSRLFDHTSREKLLNFNGIWQSSKEQELLSQLSGTILGLPLSGEFKLQRQQQTHLLTGRIGSEPTDLTREILTRWDSRDTGRLLSGKLKKLSLSLKKQWDADQAPVGMPQISAELAIAALEWETPKRQQLQEFAADLRLKERQLLLKNGRIVIGNQPIHFAGRVDGLFQQPTLDLQLSAKPKLAFLSQQLGLAENWKLTGQAPVTLRLHGAVGEPDFRLDLNLTAAGLALDKLLQKPAGQTAGLQLEGSLGGQRLKVDRAELQLGAVKLSGKGSFPLNKVEQTFRFDLEEFDLAKLQRQSPLLKRLKLVGKARLSLERQKSGLQGKLQLADVGAHLFHIVGDLNHTTGAIQFDQQGLNFSNLKASLGRSPLTVSGKLDSWKDPQLKLNIQGSKVRAQDLIFRNQQLTLYDLDAKLRVTASDLFFDSIKVRLEEATLATVSGKIANFKDPQTILDIQSERADILAVIKLFIGPPKGPHLTQRKDYKPLIINVRADKGTLGGLRFTEATGTITDHLGIFTIFPLRFKSGPGYCFSRVEIDRTQKNGLLKVSGHAEDLDASVLHEDIFLRRGLVSGRLRGDFYLEGKPGEDFWPTARGGIHLQLKNGTLRKFRGLAQVFSILNVSQLFSFKLPDMDDEGMPFDLLEGSIRVADGLMTTQDMHIVSEAMNMSLVGTKNLIEDSVDFDLAVMPLRTVDKVITNIPIAGWILTGEEQALVSAQFKIRGPSENPAVTAVPISSVSDTVFGILKRTIGLPIKLIKDIDNLFNKTPKKK